MSSLKEFLYKFVESFDDEDWFYIEKDEFPNFTFSKVKRGRSILDLLSKMESFLLLSYISESEFFKRRKIEVEKVVKSDISDREMFIKLEMCWLGNKSPKENLLRLIFQCNDKEISEKFNKAPAIDNKKLPFKEFVSKSKKLKREREIIGINGEIVKETYKTPENDDSIFMERCMRVGRLVRALDNPYEDVHSSANFEKIVHISLLCDWNEVDELDLLQN